MNLYSLIMTFIGKPWETPSAHNVTLSKARHPAGPSAPATSDKPAKHARCKGRQPMWSAACQGSQTVFIAFDFLGATKKNMNMQKTMDLNYLVRYIMCI